MYVRPALGILLKLVFFFSAVIQRWVFRHRLHRRARVCNGDAAIAERDVHARTGEAALVNLFYLHFSCDESFQDVFPL